VSEALFQLERASVTLTGREVLREITLEIGADERVCLLGASGSGKTTLLRVLGALQALQTGKARFGGESVDFGRVRRLRDMRSQIGFMHQDLALVPNLSVAQNVLAGRLGRLGFWRSLRTMLLTPAPELDEAFELLESLGVGERLFQRTDTLSGGEQQRVALARALHQRPRALLVDEPVSAVDPEHGKLVLELLSKNANQRGLALIASLHDPALARAYFRRIVGLREGTVVFDVPVEELTGELLEPLYRLEGNASEA
jgi:phosphonate transport system ATP-binding protein